MSRLSLLALAAFVATPAVAVEQNIWSTTFETNEYETLGPFPWGSLGTIYGGASFQSATGFTGFGNQMFRNDSGGGTSFSAVGLGGHSMLHLKFDLAFIDSWDSINGSVAPDILFVDFDGHSYQFTVNNASGSVFDVGPGTVISSGSNLGYSSWSDVIVRYDFLFAHTGPTFGMTIRFGGAGFQGGADESWGIDNFSLAAEPAQGVVPEPATWAMLIAGFGMVGATLRRRRPLVA